MAEGAAGLAGHVSGLGRGPSHLSGGLADRLALLQREDPRELLFCCFQELTEAEEQSAPLRTRDVFQLGSALFAAATAASTSHPSELGNSPITSRGRAGLRVS